MKFATEIETRLERELDGEPVKIYLPNLDGTESPSEILRQLLKLKEKWRAIGRAEAAAHSRHSDLF